MKLLCFVDLHGSMPVLDLLKEKAKHVDAVIAAGDLTTFERNIEHVFHKLSQFKKPVFVIPGNHESTEIVQYLSKHSPNIIFLEQRWHELNRVLFVGSSGNAFAKDDPEFESSSRQFVKIISAKRKLRKEAFRYVFVCHAPPHGTKLDLLYGEHHGNRSIRKFILGTKPELAVCGHFHENQGKKDKLDKTIIINPGPHGRILTV